VVVASQPGSGLAAAPCVAFLPAGPANAPGLATNGAAYRVQRYYGNFTYFKSVNDRQ
jgi:hypothetical protein